MSDMMTIKGNDLWVKVIQMLQQNWASIEPERHGVCLYFITDASQVFDQMMFENASEAEAALTRNGFRRFQDAPDLQRIIRAPVQPFRKGSHVNGPIYSSGRFWR